MKYLNSSVTSGCFWTAVLLSVQCPHLQLSLRVHLQNTMSSLSLGSVCLCSAVGAVAELSVLCDLQFGGVCGRDAVARLHAVALLQLGQSTH